MARKKKHPEHVNHERWLVSYADFITLLFATFTALFAISNRDMEKFKKLAASIKDAFSEGPKSLVQEPGMTVGGTDPNAPILININPVLATPGSGKEGDTGEESPAQMFNGNSNVKSGKSGEESEGGAGMLIVQTSAQDPSASPTPSVSTAATITPTPTPSPTPDAGALVTQSEGSVDPALAEEIKQLIDNPELQGKVEMRQEQRGMVISLGDAGFFESGSAEISPASIYKLDRIANALRDKNLEIRIEGHTDNIPIRSRRYKNNMELSTLRAVSIFEFLKTEYHFPPDHLSSTGYGEYRPVADNATPEGRQKNRRVDIIILNRHAAMAEPHPEVAAQSEVPAQPDVQAEHAATVH